MSGPAAQQVTWSVEAAFGTSPSGNAQSAATWTDLTGRVRGYTHKRGREDQTKRVEAATCTVTLDNRDRAMDPTNTTGPYYGQLVPGVPIRVQAVYNSTTYPVFFGFVERWPVSWPGGMDSTCDLQVTDAIGWLSRLPPPDSPWSLLATSFNEAGITNQWWRMSAADPTFPNGSTVPDQGNPGTSPATIQNGTYASASSQPSLRSQDTDGAIGFAAAQSSYNSGTFMYASPNVKVDQTYGYFTLSLAFQINDTTTAGVEADYPLFTCSNGSTYGIWVGVRGARTSAPQPPGSVFVDIRNSAGTVVAEAAVDASVVNCLTPLTTHNLIVAVGPGPSFGHASGVNTVGIFIDGPTNAQFTDFAPTVPPSGYMQIGPFDGNGRGYPNQDYTYIDEVWFSPVCVVGGANWADYQYATDVYQAINGIFWNETAARRIFDFLLYANFHQNWVPPSSDTTIELPGLSSMPSTVMDGVNDCADAEQGVFFVRRDGSLRFLGFNERTSLATYTSAQWQVGNTGAAFQLAALDLKPDIGDIDRIVNTVKVSESYTTGSQTWTNATTQINAASVAAYGVREQDVQWMDQARAAALVARYAAVQPRFPTVTVEPLFDSTATSKMLANAELQTRMQVVAQPPGGGPLLTIDAHIQGETWTIVPGNSWTVTLQLDLGI